MFTFSSVLMVLVVVVVLFVVLAGVHRAALRAGRSPGEARRTTSEVALVLGAFLVFLVTLVATGVLARFELRPPPMFLVLGGGVALSTLLGRRAVAAGLLDATPRHWLVAIHAMRLPIEIVLWGLFVAGRFPVHLTFEGRNTDVLVGVAAPVVALLVYRGKIGSRGQWVWNVVSLASLANIVGMAITSMPGPLQLAWPGVPNTVVAELPFVFLPGVLVPIALQAHVLSIRKLLRETKELPAGIPQRIGGGL